MYASLGSRAQKGLMCVSVRPVIRVLCLCVVISYKYMLPSWAQHRPQHVYVSPSGSQCVIVDCCTCLGVCATWCHHLIPILMLLICKLRPRNLYYWDSFCCYAWIYGLLWLAIIWLLCWCIIIIDHMVHMLCHHDIICWNMCILKCVFRFVMICMLFDYGC